MLEKVLKFAIKHHGDQLYGTLPYSFHLMQVFEICKQYGIIAQIIAILHDVKEDTAVTDKEILELISSLEEIPAGKEQFILDAIYYISDEKGKNRKERKQKTNEKLSKIQEDFFVVLIVKVADRLCNTKHSIESKSTLFEMYQREYPEFKKAVFREGLCDLLWLELDQLMQK